MDRFGRTGKVSKQKVHFSKWWAKQFRKFRPDILVEWIAPKMFTKSWQRRPHLPPKNTSLVHGRSFPPKIHHQLFKRALFCQNNTGSRARTLQLLKIYEMTDTYLKELHRDKLKLLNVLTVSQRLLCSFWFMVSSSSILTSRLSCMSYKQHNYHQA